MTLNTIVQEIPNLTIEERQTLITLLVASLAEQAHTHSLLELDGLGAEIWRGIDTDEYVRQLRSEWDDRP